jgi:ankyrin repeat/BTB/POZ domain-containing protein 2
MVMEYLYNGGCECIRNIEPEDVLELMAAANFFQLDGLLRFCESKCSQTVNIESIVSMYIHAKVSKQFRILEGFKDTHR